MDDFAFAAMMSFRPGSYLDPMDVAYWDEPEQEAYEHYPETYETVPARDLYEVTATKGTDQRARRGYEHKKASANGSARRTRRVEYEHGDESDEYQPVEDDRVKLEHDAHSDHEARSVAAVSVDGGEDTLTPTSRHPGYAKERRTSRPGLGACGKSYTRTFPD